VASAQSLVEPLMQVKLGIAFAAMGPASSATATIARTFFFICDSLPLSQAEALKGRALVSTGGALCLFTCIVPTHRKRGFRTSCESLTSQFVRFLDMVGYRRFRLARRKEMT
jgi:hypothetical protein